MNAPAEVIPMHQHPPKKKPVTGEVAVRMLAIDLIDESPTNQRTTYPAEPMKELAANIAARAEKYGVEKALIQPILVRPKGERFELVAGHRRRRAAKMAGLVELAAIVRE